MAAYRERRGSWVGHAELFVDDVKAHDVTVVLTAYVDVAEVQPLEDPTQYVDVGSSWDGHIEGLTEAEQLQILRAARTSLKLDNGRIGGFAMTSTDGSIRGYGDIPFEYERQD
jgi:hypothetical protein